MIFDKLKNHKNYRGLVKGLDDAFDYLLANDLEALGTGRHEIAGEALYAACMEYDTKIEALSKNEGHRKYIDVQYIVSGVEKMHTSETGNLKTIEEYDSERDVIFFEQKSECVITAEPGCFAVFFPEDAHMPGVNPDSESIRVKKVVVKVHV